MVGYRMHPHCSCNLLLHLLVGQCCAAGEKLTPHHSHQGFNTVKLQEIQQCGWASAQLQALILTEQGLWIIYETTLFFFFPSCSSTPKNPQHAGNIWLFICNNWYNCLKYINRLLDMVDSKCRPSALRCQETAHKRPTQPCEEHGSPKSWASIMETNCWGTNPTFSSHPSAVTPL